MTKPAYYPKLGAQLKYFYPTIASIFKTFRLFLVLRLRIIFKMVEEAGFEPTYSERTDLQSAAFNRSATPPEP
jgi:hypothetical protein